MQDDKEKLKLLVDMVKVLSERVDFLSQRIGIRRALLNDIDKDFQKKIKDIEKQIE